MIYPIVFEPDHKLHKPSAKLDKKTILEPETQTFIKDMVQTMYAKDGVGLAAVQVGKNIQICTIIKTYNTLNKRRDLCLINPEWTKLSVFKEWDEEGCLSVPGIYGKIKRYTKLKVKALDEKGEPIEFVAEGFFARIIQHEVDHLNGKLFIESAKDFYEYKK